MDANPKKKGMTLKRIMLMEMVLLIAAQTAITSIGLFYAGSIARSIYAQRTSLMTEQFTQNVTLQLNDINNLLLFLSSSDIIDYFKNYMSLRDGKVNETERRRLQDKLDALRISPGIIESIYLIGGNTNQMACRKVIGAAGLEDISDLRLETLEHTRIDSIFLLNQNQFVRYSKDDFMAGYKPDSPTVKQEERDELEKFLLDIEGRLVISNVIGNSPTNVFIAIVLNEQFFRQAMAKPDNHTYFTVLQKDGGVLWSTCSQPDLLGSIAAGNVSTVVSEGVWNNSSRDIRPFKLRVVYSENQAPGFFKQSHLSVNMLLVALGTLMVAFLFSLLYLEMMLQPFRRISHAIDAQPDAGAGSGVITFRPITLKLMQRGFHTISLRSKLTILFCSVIGILVSSNTFFYMSLLEHEVNDYVADSIENIGSFAIVGINNQVRYFENLSNQISLSGNFQNYLIDTPDYMVFNRPLKMFPGLNDIAYFVLLDSKGESLYSSIYLNNHDIFSIAASQLLDRSSPYWISNINYVVEDVFAAVIRKMELKYPGTMAAYLLMAPKESAFRIAGTERIMAAYKITNAAGQVLYSQGFMNGPEGSDTGHLRYQQPIAGTGWILAIDYVIPEIATMKKAYQDRFFYSIVLVFLFSVITIVRVSSVLTRSLLQTRNDMQLAESQGAARLLDFDRQDEISGIINSYNRMIVRLEEIVRDNMRIMEENARNKIREKELLSMKARAEMNMLQAQINPHFLNNTLCAINIKNIRQGNTDISRTVNALSELLRYSMAISRDTAPLEQELSHAANYILIQQICLGNSFSVHFDISGELYGYSVLRIILQPLIENAIQHGFEGWESGGDILISARQKEGMLEIRVRDNGVGMDAETLEWLRREMTQELTDWKADGGGIGLRNVYYRLKLRYQDSSQLSIESALMKGTEICMAFPAERSSFVPGDENNI